VNDSQILKGKRAVIFGASGSIGGAVAQTFAVEGAQLYLAGRSQPSLDTIARQINDAGGRAQVAVVDALDETSVDKYLDQVVEQAGGIDIEFNATGPRAAEYGTGTPALDVSIDQFLIAQKVLTAQFITAR
jgi:NAD(P)-dependent dehydrogenase (short-subunit alcohol dehydrogenase family)